MKKILLIILISLALPCFAYDEDLKLQNIFITDTTEAEEYLEPSNITLKGYAEYLEDTEAVTLTDDNDEFVLNLKVPQKITSKRLVEEHAKILAQKPVKYSKYGAEEYQVIPKGSNAIVSSGGLSFGTSFDQDVDYAQFEQTAGVFTRYDKGRFGLKTSYERTIGSTNNSYIDNIYLTPEFRINNIVSIKEELSSNITYRRKKAELILSIKPFANTKDDRLNLELSAGQTYYEDTAFTRNRLKFNTKFKL